MPSEDIERGLGLADVEETYETIDATDPKDKIIEELTGENEIKARKIKSLRAAVLAVALVLGIVVIAIGAAAPLTFKYIASISLSGDKATVRDFNIALENDERLHGKPNDETAVLQVLSNCGFQIDQWNPSTVYYKAYWYAEANRFLLYNSQTKQVEYPSEYQRILLQSEGKYTLYLLENGSLTLLNIFILDGYIYFGAYPQTQVTEGDVISVLKTEANRPTADGGNRWKSYGYYVDGDNTTEYMLFVDLDYNGERYRGVKFTQYRPASTEDDSSIGTSYQDKYGYSPSAVYWFRYEPIKWRILDEADGEALIFSEMALDSQDYCHYVKDESFAHNGGTGYANNYALSDIRAWLNDTFYNTAFNDQQKELILLTTVDNSARSTNPNNNATLWNNGNNSYACDDTEDYVFLLSEQEATNAAYGFADYNSATDGAREKRNTDYAKIQGAYTSTDGSYSGNNEWWLRTPYYFDGYRVRRINYDSYADFRGDANSTNVGVVPALKIKLSTMQVNTAENSNHLHAYTRVVTAPTCTDQGYTTYTCSICADTQVEAYVEALGHDITHHDAKSPDCTASGWAEYDTCSRCDYTTYAAISALGHNYVDGACERCGLALPYTRYGNKVYFGSFPQSRITDETLVAALNEQIASAGAFAGYLDIDYGGERYRQQNGAWYLFEPLEWNVLTESDGSVLLLSNKKVDHNSMGSTTYEKCSMRTWLNETFLSEAFTQTQQAVMKEVVLQDKVFLLSEEEGLQYSVGQKSATAYAKAQGAGDGTAWWLRTNVTSTAFRYVANTGRITDGSYSNGRDRYSIVPALWLQLID